jgi:hypothetical protein
MEETLHDRATERTAAPAESGDGATSAAPRNPGGNAPRTGEIVTICGWCPEVNVLKVQRRHTDVLVIVVNKIHPPSVLVLKNGVPMQISHGICAPCRDKHFPETVNERKPQP